MSFELSRRQYADLYGPTTGDAIRLADTELFLEIEKDLTVYGEEVVFGGGKVIRDGMGQNGQVTRDGDINDGAVPDTVITNVAVLDVIGFLFGLLVMATAASLAGVSPLALPALFTFVATWTNFIWPFIVLDPQIRCSR